MAGKKPGPPEQLDLFGGREARLASTRSPPPEPKTAKVQLASSPRDERGAVTSMSDDDLIGTLTSMPKQLKLAAMAEIGRRRITGAVPTLARVCRLFMGHGTDVIVPEQIAAIEALTAVGSRESALSLTELIDEQVIIGPNLLNALVAAADLGSVLAHDVMASLLHSDDTAIRVAACRLVRGRREEMAQVRLMLVDRSPEVRLAAACCLGSLGHEDVRPTLLAAADRSPSLEVIEGLAGVIDAETVVRLGRIARLAPEWREAILSVLDDCDLPSAAKVAAGLRVDEHNA